MKKQYLIESYKEKIVKQRVSMWKASPSCKQYEQGILQGMKEALSDIKNVVPDWNTKAEFSSGSALMLFVAYLTFAQIRYEFDGGRGLFLPMNKTESCLAAKDAGLDPICASWYEV